MTEQIEYPEKIYLKPFDNDTLDTWWFSNPPDCDNPGHCDFATYTRDGVPAAYVRELEAVVSEAVDILSGLLVQDDTGLAFVSPADGRVLGRAVKFLAAASEDSES